MYRLSSLPSLLMAILLTISCNDKRKESIVRLVEQWQGREVIFPKQNIFTIQTKDTVSVDLYAPIQKVLVYVDSIGCTSCRLQLHEWKKFIAEVDSATKESVLFLFFLTPKEVKEVKYITRRDDFKYPICVDMHNHLDSLNRFPKEDMFHTFLLGPDNRVSVIGNPIHNRAVRNLFMKTLTRQEKKQSVKTIIELPIHELDLGSLELGEKTNVSFSLRNAGDKPMIIFDVVTSCGCTIADFEKKPVKPNEKTEINITYTAEESGQFNKSITVYANAENSPIKIRIRGEVK